jgi:hypothetical protein
VAKPNGKQPVAVKSGGTLTDLAERIKAARQQAEESFRAGMTHAVEVGRLLIEAKDQLEHGEWLPWLKDHCDLTERLAQKYMRVAREVDRLGTANTPRVADLSFRQALQVFTKNGQTARQVPEENGKAC